VISPRAEERNDISPRSGPARYAKDDIQSNPGEVVAHHFLEPAEMVISYRTGNRTSPRPDAPHRVMTNRSEPVSSVPQGKLDEDIYNEIPAAAAREPSQFKEVAENAMARISQWVDKNTPRSPPVEDVIKTTNQESENRGVGGSRNTGPG